MRYLKFLTAHLLKYVEVSIHLDKKKCAQSECGLDGDGLAVAWKMSVQLHAQAEWRGTIVLQLSLSKQCKWIHTPWVRKVVILNALSHNAFFNAPTKSKAGGRTSEIVT